MILEQKIENKVGSSIALAIFQEPDGKQPKMYNHEASGKTTSGLATAQRRASLARQSSKASRFDKRESLLSYLAFVMTAGALMLNSAQALSLISEKCDPNKVGPDETTVKGGWQAEMFNGLSFRACG